jgi:hypothetical protein
MTNCGTTSVLMDAALRLRTVPTAAVMASASDTCFMPRARVRAADCKCDSSFRRMVVRVRTWL